MDLNEYQQQIVNIWENKMPLDELLLFCCVGMAEEAGEAMGKIKRWMRGEGFDRKGYLKELGDVLAYLVMAAHSRGIKLDFNSYANTDATELVFQELLLGTSKLFVDTAYLLEIVFESTKCQKLLPYFHDTLDTLVACTEVAHSTPEEVMQLNLDKLTDRIARNGTVRGSGDNR